MNQYRIVNRGTMACVSSMGGTIIEFKVEDKNIFYPWRMDGEKQRGGCPICAPWFSRSPRGPQHGHLRNMEAVSHEHFGNTCVELSFQWPGDDNNKLYPWSMEYVATALVGYNSLKLVLEITRQKDGIVWPAPILPGFHPYFACSDASKVKVFMGNISFFAFPDKTKTAEARMIPITDSRIYIATPERKMEIMLGENFEESSHLVFWTDAPDKYFCIEPIIEDKRMFDTEAGQHLAQSQSLRFVVYFLVHS